MPTKTKVKDDKQRILEFYEPSIAKLEASIAELDAQAATKPTKTITNKITSLKAEINRKKKDNKAAALPLESDNTSRLFFVESTQGWYKLTGRSALYFHFDVAPRLKRPTRYNLVADSDSYANSSTGVISVRLTDEFIAELAELEIIPTDLPDNVNPSADGGGIIAYKLPWSYNATEIDRLLDRLNEDNECLNALIVPKNLIPELYDLLRELSTVIYHNCRTFPDPFARDTIGKDLMEKAGNTLQRYLEVANGANDLELGLRSILKNLCYIRYSLVTISELHLIQSKRILKIGTNTVLAERIIRKYLNGNKK